MSNERVKIIAEAGQNHNGSLDLALKLIDAAVEAGADFVKFQKREPRISTPRDQWDKMRSTPWGEMTYIEYREHIELTKADYDFIDSYCKGVGIPWTASAWDLPSVDFLEQYDIPFHKVASAKLTDDELLRKMCTYYRDIILSTGMSTVYEITHATRILEDESKCRRVLLHCNSTYPCPNEDLNLRCILSMQAAYPGFEVGYSGHETGLPTTVAAVALGAEWIERHITLDRAMWGTDQAASVEPQGFKRLVQYIRATEVALGDGVKRVTEGEMEPRRRLRGVGV